MASSLLFSCFVTQYIKAGNKQGLLGYPTDDHDLCQMGVLLVPPYIASVSLVMFFLWSRGLGNKINMLASLTHFLALFVDMLSFASM